jgi:uncharacterized Ntn-hydrolase superfamily protein
MPPPLFRIERHALMTFSIAARCPATGMFGLAVASSSPAVAARCSHVGVGAGAVASQNITDPRLGMSGLDHLAAGRSAEQTLELLKAQSGELIAYRQLTIIDRKGGTAAFSGEKTLGIHAKAHGPGAVAAGNMLASSDVPQAMLTSYATTGAKHFGERLILAMRAGLEAGGEAGPIHSIGLKVTGNVPWPIADLRVDWHDADPVGELAKLWAIYAPQLDDYVIRALDPTKAPAFGVPGDK